jgi:RimJ/RimL family protein N-acetyltransferase
MESSERPVVFRRLRPSDRDRLVQHLLRLDEEDRQSRFAGIRSDLAVRQYCEAFDWTRSIAVGAEIDGELRALGELKPFGYFRQQAAEVAVTVEKPFQGRGIGTRLFGRLTGIAANRGIGCIHVVCVAQNQKMRNIAMRYNPYLKHYENEIEGRIRLPWPNLLTFAQEMLDTWSSAVRGVLARLRVRSG